MNGPMSSDEAAVSRTSRMTTVEAIEKAALELLAERGFADTSVEDIAAAAGISRRTFFRYFDSKNDIPFGNLAAFLRQLQVCLGAQPHARPLLDSILAAVVRFRSEQRRD